MKRRNKQNSQNLFLIFSVFILTALFLPQALSAAVQSEAINLATAGDELFLGPHIRYLEDERGTLDILEVASPNTAWKFKRCKRISPGFGFTSSVFWFRFTLYNPGSKTLTRFLEIEYPLLDHIDLYAPDGKGDYKIYRQGDRQVFFKRPIKYRNFVFILKVPPQKRLDYFLRVKTSSSLNLPARLYTQAGFMDKIENEETALGIYFGILFAMLAYNLILFFTIRESVYLFYVLFVIFNFLFQLDLTGVAFKYLWPNNVVWANRSLPFFILISYSFGTIFTRQIINSRQYAPILDRILSVLTVVSLLFSGLCLVIPYDISIKAATLLAMTVVIHILAGFLCLFRGYRPARYYALAWSISMAGAAIYALKSFGILPNNFLTVWGIQIGSAWEVILLSMALSDRLALLQKEKDLIQTEYTRKLEEANLRLEEFAKTLEEKVMQRTLELERSNRLLQKQAEEMRLAEERAERASKAKSDFLANMSHEIRTPLNAITGITALALDMDLPEKLRGYLNIIQVSANSLLNLVSDILDFSKIEAGRMELEETDFQLLDIFENIADMFTEMASEKSIDFIIDVDSRVPERLVGDPIRLGQLLTNLVSNAMKFTEKGSVILSCNLLSEAPGSVRLSFKVSDTGIGIGKDKLGYLFDMFTQADSSTTRRFGGTGLGLTICKRIATLMGGTIGVESEPAKGTTFTFDVEMQKSENGAGEDLILKEDFLTDLRLYLFSRNQTLTHALENIIKRLSIRDFRLFAPGELEVMTSETAPSKRTCFLVDITQNELEHVCSVVSANCDKKFLLFIPFGLQERISSCADNHLLSLCLKPVTISRLTKGLRRLLTPEEQDEAKTKDTQGLRLRDTRILVVEDNEINQMVAKEILEKFGAAVEFASNGLEAIEKASPVFDLIFMDIQMPDMDGYEATKVLRKNEDLKETPIIAMTAGVFKEDRQRCFEAGMDDFVMKPVTPESVANVLRKWIDPDKIMQETRPEIHETSDFPSISGVDMIEAQRRFGSNPRLFIELLHKFVSEQRDISEKIRPFLDRENGIERLERLFHTQKGVSANLALNELRDLFLKAEKAAKARNEGLKDIIYEIEKHIKALEKALSNIEGPTETRQETQKEAQASQNELKKLLLKLDELLELNDIECEDIWRKVKGKLEGTISDQEISQLENLIEDLEFEAARDHLAQIRSKI